MKLKQGQKAPKIDINDIWGDQTDFVGMENHKTLLSFFRYAECSICNLRISEIMRHRDELLQNNIHFVAVFESPVESLHINVANRHQFNFSIIADPERVLYERYLVKPSWISFFKTISFKAIKRVWEANKLGFRPGGKAEGAFNQIPADFLINHKGIIEIAHYGNNVIDHFPLKQMFYPKTSLGRLIKLP